MSFFAFKKQGTMPGKNIADTQERSSISFLEGKMIIDSSVIRTDLNKRSLLKSVETESLSVKKTINEVPQFIWAFLKNNLMAGNLRS